MHISKYTTQPNHTGFTHKERHIPKLTKEKQTNLTYMHTQVSTEKTQTSRSPSVETDTSYIYPCTNTQHISKDTQHKQSTRTKTHNMRTDHTHSTIHTHTHIQRHTEIHKYYEKNVKTNYPHTHLHTLRYNTNKTHTHTICRHIIQRNHTDSHRTHTHTIIKIHNIETNI